MAEKKKSRADEEPTFEVALKKLETIVEEMEAGSLSLDKMMAHYEDGMKTAKSCSDKLNEMDKKIEILRRKNDEITTEPFDEEA